MDFPEEIEYGKDIQSSENFKVAWTRQLERCLILMTKSVLGFEMGVNGLESLLSYYIDDKYLNELTLWSDEYRKEVNDLKKKAKFKKIDVSNLLLQARFNYNLNRFRSVLRLSGRNNFLPIPNIALRVGGEFKKDDDEISHDEVVKEDAVLFEAERKVKENLNEVNEDLEKMGKMIDLPGVYKVNSGKKEGLFDENNSS